jgi:class 3 adenylate cyclase
VDSTALAGQVDPEDYREVVRMYQATCAEVIQRFDGHIAQYLGDGLLRYWQENLELPENSKTNSPTGPTTSHRQQQHLVDLKMKS